MLRLCRSLLHELLDLYAPRQCCACSEAHPTSPREAPVFCAACASTLDLASPGDDGVLAPYAHGGALSRAIYHAKYDDAPQVARALGSLLLHTLEGLAVDVVLPVPLHRARLRERGYNQSTELAKALPWPVSHDAIVRARATARQVKLDHDARVSNVRGAFAAANPTALKGKRVLVLDDVVTTGSTLREAASAAIKAGAESVQCAALARAELRRAKGDE